MRSAPGMIAFSAGCAISLAIAPVALGQSGTSTATAPTRSEITNALRPVPPAMQGGEQGLPTPGTAPIEQQPKRPVSRTSLSGPTTGVRAAPAHAAELLPGCTSAPDASKASVALPTITFEFNSARLRPESQATLYKLGKSLKKDFPEDNAFVIEGQTDAAGTFAYNQELSRERAEAVKDYLIQHMHVNAERLDVNGIGYCDLANPADPRGAENRRVVIVNKAS